MPPYILLSEGSNIVELGYTFRKKEDKFSPRRKLVQIIVQLAAPSYQELYRNFSSGGRYFVFPYGYHCNAWIVRERKRLIVLRSRVGASGIDWIQEPSERLSSIEWLPPLLLLLTTVRGMGHHVYGLSTDTCSKVTLTEPSDLIGTIIRNIAILTELSSVIRPLR